MANATYSTSLYVNFGSAALYLDVYETVNVGNNTSDIRCVLILAHSGSGSPFNNSGSSASVSVGGVNIGNWSGGYNLPGNSSVVLIDATRYGVGHNADGTGSVSVSGTFNGQGNFPIGSGTASGTYTMFDINRSAGQPSSCTATYIAGTGIRVSIGSATSYINPFNYYISYRSSSDGGINYGSWSGETVVSSTTSPLQYTYSSLTPGLTYEFRVRAYNGQDNYSGYATSNAVFLTAGGKRFKPDLTGWALTVGAVKRRTSGGAWTNVTTAKRYDGATWVNLSQLVEQSQQFLGDNVTQPTERRFVMEPRLDAEVQALEAVDATKAPLASPALTGTPTAPTAAVDTSTTQLATTAFVTNQAAAATSPMNGTAAVGTSKRYARQDHVHPTDTTRAPLASPTFTGTPAAPTAAADTNTTQVATTAYVVGQASATAPVMDGTAAAGTSLKYARADHVHPTDTSRSPVAGSSSITTVGTITSGTWNATDVALGAGGTNASLTAVNGGVVYSNATAMAITAAGTQDQVLKSNGAAAPTWQTLDLTYMPDAAYKKSVKAATTANITLSAPQTIDGISVVAGDRVLVKNQTTASQNGIYVVQAAAWTRATDANSISKIAGATVNVDSGTQGAQLWTNNLKTTDTLDTTSMVWYRIVDTSYTIPVSQGGTGRTTLTANSYLKGNGTTQIGMQTGIPVADITGLNLDSLSDVVISSPTAGQTLAYNGTNWINGSGGGGGVTASATAPASPVNGSAWFDTNDGTLYVYYTDANSSQWVEVQADSALGSQLTTRMSTAESNITALTAKDGLVPIVPTSVVVGSGSASVNSVGLVTFTGASSISINGCFTSAYTNYRIMFNESAASAYADGNLRMRSSGTDATTNYFRNGLLVDATSISGFQSTNDTNYGNALTTHPNSVNTAHAQSTIEIREPFLSKPTTLQVINGAWNGTQSRHISTTGFHSTAASYDGFTIYLSSGNFAGTFKIYGYNQDYIMPALDFPATPTNGQVYTQDGSSWTYDSTKGAWRSSPYEPGAAITSASAPTNPQNGDIWFDTDDGTMYVYYNDGTSSQWTEMRSQIATSQVGLVPIVPTTVNFSGGTATANSLGTVSFTSVTSLSLNNVFSSAYKNYRMIISDIVPSVSIDFAVRLRASGTDNSSANYYYGALRMNAAGTSQTYTGNGSTLQNLARMQINENQGAAVVDILNPFATKPSKLMVMAMGHDSSWPTSYTGSGWHNVSSSFDGISLLPSSGNITGSVTIFGYNS